ncbi:EF-hand domain [Phytophthora cactorum]|nr:EF-hand domain [Phytophthora cactorum]
MIEVEPTMWLLVLAVAWGIHGLSTVIEEVSLVKLLVISAWTLVLLHCLVLLYLRSCVHQLLEIAGYSENKSVLYVNLALVAEEEMGAWESETAESALDTMNRVHELQEEITRAEATTRSPTQRYGAQIRLHIGLQYPSFGCAYTGRRNKPLYRDCGAPVPICSFSAPVFKGRGLTIAYLETVVRSHDLDHSGLIEIDSLRAILASVGFSLTRFRFSSVVNLLFDLKGTSVEYVQLFQLLVLVQQDHEGDDQRSGFHEFQRRSASFDDKGANNSISAVDLSLSTIQRFGLLNQSSVASDLASSDFAFLRTVSPTLRRISPSGQLPVSKDETHIRRSMLQRSYTNQITGSSSRALHYMYNVRQLTQFQEEAAAKDASMV